VFQLTGQRAAVTAIARVGRIGPTDDADLKAVGCA
jgi:hypothetical protein